MGCINPQSFLGVFIYSSTKYHMGEIFYKKNQGGFYAMWSPQVWVLPELIGPMLNSAHEGLILVTLSALAYQVKDIVFRFIIEYSSLRDFYRPLGYNNNTSIFFFIMRIFDRWYFGLCWNLRLVIIEL
jgi:hypothetical protein